MILPCISECRSCQSQSGLRFGLLAKLNERLRDIIRRNERRNILSLFGESSDILVEIDLTILLCRNGLLELRLKLFESFHIRTNVFLVAGIGIVPIEVHPNIITKRVNRFFVCMEDEIVFRLPIDIRLIDSDQ